MKFYVFIAFYLSSLPNSSLYVNYFVRDMNSTFWDFSLDSILYFSEFTDFRREGGGKKLKKKLYGCRLLIDHVWWIHLYYMCLDWMVLYLWKIAFFTRVKEKKPILIYNSTTIKKNKKKYSLKWSYLDEKKSFKDLKHRFK